MLAAAAHWWIIQDGSRTVELVPREKKKLTHTAHSRVRSGRNCRNCGSAARVLVRSRSVRFAYVDRVYEYCVAAAFSRRQARDRRATNLEAPGSSYQAANIRAPFAWLSIYIHSTKSHAHHPPPPPPLWLYSCKTPPPSRLLLLQTKKKWSSEFECRRLHLCW